jgi:ABC-type sugar transport system permease subunit
MPPAPPARDSRLWSFQARYAPYLFVAPFLILFLCFMLYPLARSGAMSLYSTYGPRVSRFVGLGHYRFFLTDRLFWLAILNTVAYAILIVALQIPLSLGLALLLNGRRVRFRPAFRFAFFSPFLVGNVFVSVIFALLLAQRHGLLAVTLGRLHEPWRNVNWLGDMVDARLAVVIATLWLTVGWGMVFFLAALQGVDRELYDAASVDGAGRWARFRHVTLPGIRPVTAFLIVVATAGAFQLFELPYVLFLPTGNPAGPGFAGLTVVMYLYQQGFDAGDIGAACAIGWFLMLLVTGVALLQIRLTRAGRVES